MTSYRPQELPCYAETAPPAGGLSHGGVAIGYRASEMLLKEVSWPNPEEFEVICAAGSLRGHSKKVFILAAYMPPAMLSRAVGPVWRISAMWSRWQR